MNKLFSCFLTKFFCSLTKNQSWDVTSCLRVCYSFNVTSFCIHVCYATIVRNCEFTCIILLSAQVPQVKIKYQLANLGALCIRKISVVAGLLLIRQCVSCPSVVPVSNHNISGLIHQFVIHFSYVSSIHQQLIGS